MDAKTVTALLSQAVQAPSGDNSQPWRFTWSEKKEVLSVYNLPDNDNPVFNYKQRGSLIAHGALLENIRLLGTKAGLQAVTQLLPDNADPNLVAHVNFTESSVTPDPLVTHIGNRSTNRKAYHVRPLTAQERETLLNAGGGEIALTFEQEEAGNATIADAVSTPERIMLQYKPLHDYFFQMIRWSRSQEKKWGGGLYVKTMELLPPQLAIFKLYSFWPIARILNRLGMPAFIAKENANIYKQASAFILLTHREQTPESYITLGGVLQRVWLTATSLGLSMQPVAGIIYLNQRLTEDPAANFTITQRDLITRAIELITSNFKVKSDNLRMLVRVGQAEAPSARAHKQIPTLEII